MSNIINAFWIVISAILFASAVCLAVAFVVMACKMAHEDKKRQLQFNTLSRYELHATTRVLLAKDAKIPKRARYMGSMR